MERTEADREETNKLLDEILSHNNEWAIVWLRSASHSHKTQIITLLDKLKDLRALYLQHRNETVLTVREAQLLQVCRICRGTFSAPFVLNFGEEYAHENCLKSGERNET